MSTKRIEIGHMPLKDAVDLAQRIQHVCGAVIDLEILPDITTIRVIYDDTNQHEEECLMALGIIEPEDEAQAELRRKARNGMFG